MRLVAKMLGVGILILPIATAAAPPGAATPATPAAPSEASYEYLVRMAQRLASENADSASRVRQLQVRLGTLQNERNGLLTRIRTLETRFVTLGGAERDAVRADIAGLRLQLERVDAAIATLRAQIADETEQQRVREQERQRVLAAIEAKRPRLGKAPLPPPAK